MQNTNTPHTFHIPVMGIGFTIDTPIRVAPLGISSVISMVDDTLAEKMRELYSKRLSLPYSPITKNDPDHRARRFTEYLNMVNRIVQEKFEGMKRSFIEAGNDFQRYMDLLPSVSEFKRSFHEFMASHPVKEDISRWVDARLHCGSIDVNIMTKLDKDNYNGDEKLSAEFRDAHAALRGYAQSDLRSSIVFSAGMNPRLYGYIEKFDDFYPDAQREIKKKIVIKVSDYRSALIQGKFLAKKGLWVSEYRIESGLNCGGHAFATDGYLMGPILAEFKKHRHELLETTHGILVEALKAKQRNVPDTPLPMKITAQGGVGTHEEHEFLMSEYGIDSVGWGTPFLLVPEVTNVDDHTRQQLARAKEEDLYLSDISPVGVPFNSLRGNTKDAEKQAYIDKGRPGSPCPRKHLELNTEYGERAICVASREYQFKKLNELEAMALPADEHKKKFDAITDKACICVGLGTPALIVNELETKVEGPGVSVCPGPNLAYFDKIVSLKEMVDHIYGRISLVNEASRPHMFVKELVLYVDYLKKSIADAAAPLTEKQLEYFRLFHKNLMEGIAYYKTLFADFEEKLAVLVRNLLDELEQLAERLNSHTLAAA